MNRIASCCLILSTLVLTTSAQLPVKFDDQYKTIFAKDLCRLAASNADLVLIDVRSPGEYSDTSQYNYLNIGHLKSAINIPIDTLQKNISLLDPYKNKTLVFYCSHSQRSRRISHLLSQKGFTNVYNLNGGMSHLNQMTEKEFPCKQEWLQSNLKYQNISSVNAIELIKKNPELIILDVRPASMFYSRDSLVYYNTGRLKKAINIPYTELKQRLNELTAYKNKPILVYAQAGNNNAGRTALELKNNDFSGVYVLIGGFDDMLVREDASSLIEGAPPYRILHAAGTLSLLKNNKNVTVYDTRSKMEFENKMPTQEYYRNLGHIKNAINIEAKEFDSFNYPKDKNVSFLIYGRDDAYRLAQKLTTDGYKNVYVLRNLYDFIASAFNVEGNKDVLLYMTNHDGLY
jgi:rhodanese-related sulfurtransferase